MDITMQMHTFQPLVLLGWYTFLIRPMSQEEAKTKLNQSTIRNQLIGTAAYIALLTCSLSMALPWPQIGGALEEIESSLLPYFENVVEWNDQLLHLFSFPLTSIFGIEQGVWALFNGGFHGDSLAATVVATLSDGSEVEDFWTTPDWVNMPRLKQKRMFNFINFYKHLSDCRGCSEQQKLLHRLAKEPRIQELEVLQLALYSQDVYPPPPPENVGWWEPVRQPLEVDLRGFEMGLILCRNKAGEYCNDHEAVFIEDRLLNEDEIEEGYYLGADDQEEDQDDEEEESELANEDGDSDDEHEEVNDSDEEESDEDDSYEDDSDEEDEDSDIEDEEDFAEDHDEL